MTLFVLVNFSLLGCHKAPDQGQAAQGPSAQDVPAKLSDPSNCTEKFRLQADQTQILFVDSPLTTIDDEVKTINTWLDGVFQSAYWALFLGDTKPKALRLEKFRSLGGGGLDVLTTEVSVGGLELRYRHVVSGLPVLYFSQKFQITGDLPKNTCALNLLSTERVDFTSAVAGQIKASGHHWNSTSPSVDTPVTNTWELASGLVYWDQPGFYDSKTLQRLKSRETALFKDAYSPILRTQLVAGTPVPKIDPATGKTMKFTPYRWELSSAGIVTETRTLYISSQSQAMTIMGAQGAEVFLTKLQWLAVSLH